MPKVSVIIPTHNRPHLLARADAESARAAGADVEIIVVDDASRDATAAVCQNLTGIKYVRVERNQGVAGARNIGILASTGKYVAFLDDDDLRLPGSLDIQLQALRQTRKLASLCGAMIWLIRIITQRVRLCIRVMPAAKYSGNCYTRVSGNALVHFDPQRLFSASRLLNRRVSSVDDWDIFTRIAELYPVIVMREAMGLYRQPTPDSGQGSSKRAAQLYRAAHHQKNLLRLPRAAAASVKRRQQGRAPIQINRIQKT